MDIADRLVAAQATALAGLAWPGRSRWRLPGAVLGVGAVATLAGGALAVLGALPHGSRLTPRVVPPSDQPLLREGPYALSRNPIYTGIMVGGLGWVLLRRRPEPALAWAALVAVLHLKVRHEERHLVERFGADYLAYAAATPRFLPAPA